MAGVLIIDRRGETHVEALRRPGAELGVMQPQAKGHLEPSELEEARKDPPLATLEGVLPPTTFVQASGLWGQ